MQELTAERVPSSKNCVAALKVETHGNGVKAQLETELMLNSALVA